MKLVVFKSSGTEHARTYAINPDHVTMVATYDKHLVRICISGGKDVLVQGTVEDVIAQLQKLE